MPIQPALLVSAAMLQDYFVDNATGLPMANGTITMYQDNSRTTLKNWYYQTGSPGNYTYITLPNPMTLSGVGTIQDGNGNDVIPFYYPYDENDPSVAQPYYVVVVNSNGQSQFTRQNFPFITAGSPLPPTSSGVTNTNLIVNNVFWRNIGSLNATTLTNSTTINGSTIYYATVAPSQHDGFTMSDIQFYKNANGATDTLTFFEFVPPSSGTTFPDQVFGNIDVTPEFYFNMNCTGAGTETTKYLQIPITLHVKSLSGYTNLTVRVWAMAVPGSSNGSITIGLFQYLGSGATSPITVPTETILLDNDWNHYDINIPVPSAANLTLGPGGDDALYLQIGYPAANTCNINIAKPACYLEQTIPVDEFQTYDYVNNFISSPRTGDLRTSINTFTPFGWVPMNDGTIGSSSSNATARANTDTWPLFNLLWTLAKPYDTGGGGHFNPICQLYNSSGSAIDFGSTAIGDFSANDALALTRMFGRVLLGTAPISSLLTPQSTTYTASSSGGLLITTANNVNYFNGMPIVFTNSGGALPGNIVANAVYYVSNFNGTNAFNVATSFANAITGSSLVAYSSAGSGTNTVTAAVTGTSEGEYAHTQALSEIAQHVHIPATGGADFLYLSGGTILQSGSSTGAAQTTTGGVLNFVGSPFNVTQPGTFYNIFAKL
jgi:hypothetical protein